MNARKERILPPDEIEDLHDDDSDFLKSSEIVTLPLLESHLNSVTDPMPPPTRRLADLTSPAPSENKPPADGSLKLPRCLRPRRRRGKQPAFSANENSASRMADPATPLGPSANENPAHSSATRPRSTVNTNSPFPGPQPGTSRSPRSALMKHPQTFQYSQHPQHPRSTANRNSESRSRLDHPEIRGYINRPSTASDRIHLPAVIETPSLDLASPHLLSSNPPTKPSLDRPLGLYN